MLASIQDADVFAFDVCGGWKEIDPFGGDEDFCRPQSALLFPSASALLAAARYVVREDERIGGRLHAFAQFQPLLLAEIRQSAFFAPRTEP